jgi:hypothetical protein
VLVPVHEKPEEFVQKLKNWRDNPNSEPDIEKWYNTVYKNPAKVDNDGIQRPAFLRIKKHDADYDDNNDKEVIEKELALVPDNHKALLDREGVTIETGYNISRYDRKNKIIMVGKDPEQGEVIHEIGHAIETILDLYNNEDFLNVLYKGTEIISFENIIYDKDTFGKPIIRVEMDKLISEYQGRLYEDVGIFTDDMKVNIMAMKEYFSEGYREFFINPENLKRKDEALYNFIKRNGATWV